MARVRYILFQYPWTVAILYGVGRAQKIHCGGSIISKRHSIYISGQHSPYISIVLYRVTLVQDPVLALHARTTLHARVG